MKWWAFLFLFSLVFSRSTTRFERQQEEQEEQQRPQANPPPAFEWTQVWDNNEQRIVFLGELSLDTVVWDLSSSSSSSPKLQTRVYNGLLPGPTIHMKRGSTYFLLFENRLIDTINKTEQEEIQFNSLHHPNHTNIHLHGLHVSPLSPGDYPFLEIEPSSSYLYRYDIPKDHMGGTFWYHPHHHGSTSIQIGGGAMGVIIIQDEEQDGIPSQILAMERREKEGEGEGEGEGEREEEKRGESLKPNDLEKRRERKHHKKEKKKKEEEVLETPSAEALQGEAERRRKWITHMTLANDGYSDPPGIKVRAVPGLHGIDFLAQVSVAKAQSYVFSHVIRALIDFGYDYCTLDACSYDWRLPPDKLQERDNYFGMMMRKIEAMSEHQGRRVVMLAHSMGNRVVQYFFRWVQMKRSKDWIDRNIHAFLAMGAPFLGSSKALRTVLCGDAMGLEVFLTKEEALLMARVSSSLPWLFPVNESAYPDDIIRVHSERNSELPYNPQHFTEVLHQYVPRSLGFYETFYQQDPLYLFKEEGEGGVLPVLEPPPVPRVWIINGINRETEVGYYMRGGKALMLDPSADKYSRQKKAGINPRGLLIREGIAYESSDTFQPSIKLNKSGDGTVPFASLNYAETGWANQIHVYTKEIEDAEHREMLASDAILNEIIGFVSGKTDQEAEEKELSSKALSYLLG